MRFFHWHRRIVRYLVVALPLLLALPSTLAAQSDLLELWFEYDGRPIKLSHAPQIDCFGQDGRTPVSCNLYRSEDGRYWIERPAPGSYRLRVNADENRQNGAQQPGDFYRDYSFRVDNGTTGPLLIALHRLMLLQQPQNGALALPGQAATCEQKPSLSADILALFPTAKADFSWQGLSPGSRYAYTLWRVRCSDGMRLEQMLYRQTGATMAVEAVPPNRSGEYYQFELTAINDNQTTGQLLLRGADGSVADAYHFTVSDPLIDRTWLYYLLGALALLFMGWVVVGALRSRPSPATPQPNDIRRGRSLKPLLVLLLLAGGAAAGWLQREPLLGWLEQQWPETLAQLEHQLDSLMQEQSSERVRVPVANGTGDTGEHGGASGRWRGVVVSASAQSFIGSGRRSEVSIHFVPEGARVAFLVQGRWNDVTGSAFRLQRSGEGLTLIGYRRGDGVSELVSISIPDVRETVWQLTLDRMITRRDAAGRVVASERRKASGEVHRAAP